MINNNNNHIMGKAQQTKRQQSSPKQVGDVTFFKDASSSDKQGEGATKVFVAPKPLPLVVEEVRQAQDGEWYTKKDFQGFYGGLFQWRNAKRQPEEATQRNLKLQGKRPVTACKVGKGWHTGNAFAVLV